MSKVVSKLTFMLRDLGRGRFWSRRESHIFGESSIRSEDMNSTGLAGSRSRLRPWQVRNCMMSAVGIATLLGGVLIYIRPTVAQGPPLTFEPLAGGFSPDRLRINAKGPSEILQAKIVVQPGGDTGWHTHPGPVIVVVKTGAITEFHGNGCVSVHPAGTVCVESEGEVHRVINQSSVVSESYATFILPPGTQPLLAAVDPGATGCKPGPGGDRHDH